jgi:hypothetical protein
MGKEFPSKNRRKAEDFLFANVRNTPPRKSVKNSLGTITPQTKDAAALGGLNRILLRAMFARPS